MPCLRASRIAAVVLGLLAVSGQALAQPFAERPDTDLLLVSVRLDKEVLAETLATYAAPGGALVPLGEIARLLELPIVVNVGTGQADGWFIDEKRRLHLDVRAREVVVEGRVRTVDPAEVEVHADDIYVHTRALSSWLPIDLEVDLRDSLLSVRPREALPLQARRARQSQSALLGTRPTEIALPRLAVPYRFFDGPAVDLVARVTGPAEGPVEADYAAYASMELLFMEARLRVAANGGERPDFRGSLGRHDPEGRLLGPLRAREFIAGEVFHPGLDLVALPRSGPGALVSNFPLQRSAQFDRHSFVGELPPGWEVEIFRNDDLLAYQQSRPDGRYQLDDVPLLFGLNLFRLVFHGPQGQTRTETQRFQIAEWLPRRGALHYRFAANRPDDAPGRASGELELGLARSFAATLAASQVGEDADAQRYARAGLRGYWRWLFAHADYARDDAGGSVLQGGMQTRLGPFGLVLKHAQLDDFASEDFRSEGGALASRSLARLDMVVPRTFLPRIPLNLEATHDRLESGARRTRVSQRTSLFSRGLALANQVSWTVLEDPAGQRDTHATGSLLLSRYLRRFSARGELGYGLRPRGDLTNTALTLEARASHGIVATAGLNRQLDTGQMRYLLGVSKATGDLGFGVHGDYARPGGFAWGLSLNVGLARDGRGGAWHTDALSMTSTGSLSARAFLDGNGNGLFDAGERPLEGVGVAVNRNPLRSRTDASGTLFAAQLPIHQDVEVALVRSTLEDPLWVAGGPGSRIVPRPGRVAAVDLPVVVEGEVVGTVYELRDGRSRESAGIVVELVDAGGQVVKSAISAYDGFYDITGVKPGRYRLRVVEEGLAGRGLRPPALRELVVDPANAVAEGMDLVLLAAADTLPAMPVVATAAPASVTVAQAVPGVRPVLATARPAPVDRFSVQYGAYLERPRAMDEAARLACELHRPTRVEVVNQGPGRVFHRVLVGDFVSEAAAEAYRRGTAPSVAQAAGPVRRLAAGASVVRAACH